MLGCPSDAQPMGAALVAAVAAVALSLCPLGASAASAPLAFDIDLATLTHPPLWEPTLEEYFPAQRGGERDEHGLPSPMVLASPTHEEFVYHARRGYPILVSDWGQGLPYDGWTGKDFADTFPFGYMKAEYIHEMPNFRTKDHDIKIIDGEQRFNLGSFKPDTKTMWHNLTRPASKRYKDDPQKPVTGPYVWHVKDELTEKQKKIVQARFEAPQFLNDPLNSEWMNRTFEVWFSPGSGSGAGAHNDGYCESVVSLQLKGDKKWRKMLEPAMTALHSFDEFDGGVYEAGYWKPDLGFINHQQGAVIWPPGYLHETKTLQPEDGACGAAITLQFAFPQPVQFLRAFLPRLSLSSEVSQCVARVWSGYATFHRPSIKPSHQGAEIQKQLEAILKAVDSNGDGSISVEETRTSLQKPGNTLGNEAHRYGNQHELFVKFKAEDTVAYHDSDGDMAVSRQELWDSLVQWNVVRIRMRETLKLLNRADRKGVEEYEKSLDHLRRTPVELPKKVREELGMLFKLPKGTKVFPSLKGITSLSDSEWFSPARDRIEDMLHSGRQEM